MTAMATIKGEDLSHHSKEVLILCDDGYPLPGKLPDDAQVTIHQVALRGTQLEIAGELESVFQSSGGRHTGKLLVTKFH